MSNVVPFQYTPIADLPELEKTKAILGNKQTVENAKAMMMAGLVNWTIALQMLEQIGHEKANETAFSIQSAERYIDTIVATPRGAA